MFGGNAALGRVHARRRGWSASTSPTPGSRCSPGSGRFSGTDPESGTTYQDEEDLSVVPDDGTDPDVVVTGHRSSARRVAVAPPRRLRHHDGRRRGRLHAAPRDREQPDRLGHALDLELAEGVPVVALHEDVADQRRLLDVRRQVRLGLPEVVAGDVRLGGVVLERLDEDVLVPGPRRCATTRRRGSPPRPGCASVNSRVSSTHWSAYSGFTFHLTQMKIIPANLSPTSSGTLGP